MRGLLPPVTDDMRQRVIADTVRDVQRIRARGGEVVFVRPPSSGGFLEEESPTRPSRAHVGRVDRGNWAVGIHWEDYPELQQLEIPEWSHLSRASAAQFTRVYVGQLRSRVPWLQSRLRPAAGDRRRQPVRWVPGRGVTSLHRAGCCKRLSARRCLARNCVPPIEEPIL